MSLKTQAKVLRVLQEQTMEPVGGTHADQGRRARARRDEQGSAGRDPRRPVPRGSVFPPERDPDLRAAAARARRRTSRCWRITSWPSSRASTAGGSKRFDAGRARRVLQHYSVAGQRARAAQRHRAADDHGARRRDHRAATSASSTGDAGARRVDDGRAAARLTLHEARDRSSATTSCGRSPSSRATCRAPRKCSASSAAICIGRCEAFGIAPGASTTTDRRATPDA